MSTYKDVLDEILVEIRSIGDRLNKTTREAAKGRRTDGGVSDDGAGHFTAAEELYLQYNIPDVPPWSALTNRERHGWRTAADLQVRYKHQVERAEKAEGQLDALQAELDRVAPVSTVSGKRVNPIAHAAEAIKATGGAVEIAGVRIEPVEGPF